MMIVVIMIILMMAILLKLSFVTIACFNTVHCVRALCRVLIFHVFIVCTFFYSI